MHPTHVPGVTSVHHGCDWVVCKPVCWDLEIRERYRVTCDEKGDYDVEDPRLYLEISTPVSNSSPALTTTASSGLVKWRRHQLAKPASEPEDVNMVDQLPAKKPKLRSVSASPRGPQKDESSSARLDALKANGITSIAALQAMLANCPPATPGSTSMAPPAAAPSGTVPLSTGEDELVVSEDEVPQSYSIKRCLFFQLHSICCYHSHVGLVRAIEFSDILRGLRPDSGGPCYWSC